MKKHITAFLFLFLLLIPLQVTAESFERVIITFTEAIEHELLEESAAEIHHVFDEFRAVSATLATSEIDKLSAHPAIACIEKDSVVKASAQIPSWGYQKLHVSESQSAPFGLTGKGVKIGIIDTGIDLNHPDLRVAGGVSFVEGISSYQDDSGHGTQVAGIIAALDNGVGTIGVAPDAELYAIKVLDRKGEGAITDVVAGIQWAIANGMDIINLSLTSHADKSVLKTAVQEAYNHGILIVAASGNVDRNNPYIPINDVLYPARYPSVLAVGSVNQALKRSIFSYYGANLDFVAPGEDVLSTSLVSYSPYIQTYGTSMAAPFVTGIAALYKEQYPHLDHQRIRGHMERAALDLGLPGKDTEYGYGLIQPPSNEKADLFTDLKEDAWYSEAILYLHRKGIIGGYADGSFRPNKPVTRAEAVAMLGRALELPGSQAPTKFSDVSASSFASGFIKSATDNRIISGFPDGTFRPGNNIIRGDVAVILNNAFGFPETDKVFFHDVPRKHYFNAINNMAAANITTGFSDGSFRPDQTITRVEFAVFLAKALDDRFK